MLSVFTLIIALSLTLLIVRIATIALVHTGLSQQSAQFQARSAFTGVGFTTREAEDLVNHPVRRRILMILMLVGNAGIITVMSTLVITFVQPASDQDWWLRFGLLVAGLLFFWFIATSPLVDRYLSRLITWALSRYTDLDVRDYARLLQLAGDFAVAELEVEGEDWLAHKTLMQLRLADEGVLVLGIRRDNGAYIGAPTGDTIIQPNDTLIVYGTTARFAELDERRAGYLGDAAHARAVEEEKAHKVRAEPPLVEEPTQ